MLAYPNFILGAIVIGNAILALLVFFRSKKSEAHITFAVIAFSLSLWAFTNAQFQTTEIEETAYIVSLLSYAGGAMGMNAILYFSFIFPEKSFSDSSWRKHYRWIVGLPAVFSLIVALVPGALLLSVNIVATPRELEPSWLIFPFGLQLLSAAILIFYNLRTGYKRFTGIKKLQTLFIGAGLMISIICGIVFNLILPVLGIYTYIWLGPAFTIIFIGASAYAMLRYRLFDIKIQTQNIFNFLLPMCIAVIFASLVAYAFYQFTLLERSLIGSTVMFVSLLTYELVRRWLQNSALSYMFFSRTHKYQLALQNLAVEAPTMVNINELSERIVSTLIENMGMSKAAIIISQSAYAENEFDLLHHEGFSEEQCSAFITPTAELMNAFHSSRMTYVKDELQVELLDPELSPKVESFIRHTQHALEVADASIVLSLKVRDTLLGFLVLGNKTRGSFTVEDISLLEEISNQLAVALMHSRMHEEKTVLTRMLREEVSQATNAWKEKSLENEELSNVKSQFIEVASHQLRTPISVIRNSVQMVLDDYLAEQDIPEELQQIVPLLRNAFLASDNLNNSINSILAAEEFIDKKPHVHVERVNLESFLQRRVRRAKALIDAKSASEIVLKTDIAADVPEFIVTDEEKTAMILDQLLMNAVLYTTEGDVTLKVTIKNEHIEFSISDTGIGIPESEEGTIFERFVRLKGAQRVVPDGTGLGLYLAKEYSNLLRGQLRFTSEEGDGSTFIVSIPVQYSYV